MKHVRGCPDGPECVNYTWCQEFKEDGDPCPLVADHYGNHDVPLDKLFPNPEDC